MIYEEAWKKGKMHDHSAYHYYTKGKIPRENGRYMGGFRQNRRNGHDVYTLPDGSIYDGEFRDNVQNGYGVFRWPGHGAQGIATYPKGQIYDGTWVQGKREGKHDVSFTLVHSMLTHMTRLFVARHLSYSLPR